MENKEFIKQFYKRKGLTEEGFFLEILFAIFCKMKKEGYDELHLDSKSVFEYAPRLKSIFERLGITSEAFSRTPVEETYDRFSNYAIQILIERNFGYFNADYNKIIIAINPYMISKTLKEYEELKNFIEECYLCITNQLPNLKGKNNILMNDETKINEVLDYCKAYPYSPIRDGAGFYKVKAQDFCFPDGTIETREYIDKNRASIVVPITEEGNVVLIAQPTALTEEGALIEFPAGYWEIGENGEEAGVRELGEETGYVPSHVTYLGSHYQDPGCIRQKVDVYLAMGCKKVQSQKLDKGEFIKYIEVPYNYALYLMDNGYLKDANSYIALSKADRFLKREYYQEIEKIDGNKSVKITKSLTK